MLVFFKHYGVLSSEDLDSAQLSLSGLAPDRGLRLHRRLFIFTTFYSNVAHLRNMNDYHESSFTAEVNNAKLPHPVPREGVPLSIFSVDQI
jgi:hypothetical protein